MKRLALFVTLINGIIQVHALVISEVMSNPTGDDSGREWVELYNNETDPIDLSSLTISIKGALPVLVTPLSGGTTLDPNTYAIITSVVSGSTKFIQDYPLYSGSLFKSSVSLVNTGTTSVDIRLHGTSVDVLSYTAAKEGLTLSLIGGVFVPGNPTSGTENQIAPSSGTNSSSATTTDNQATVAQMSPPSSDIILYMPFEKTVVAGAETDFSVYGLTRAGKSIEGLTCMWAFGDGGQAIGTSTKYRYSYTGRYIAQAEGTNGYVGGVGRMTVRVVPPEIAITKIATGKYGAYVDIVNPNEYSLDLSQWRLVIDSASFPFPKNTLIAGNSTTHFSGLAMGFASTTLTASTTVKILFPNLEEVTRYVVEMPPLQAPLASSSPKDLAPVRTPFRFIARTIPSATTTQLQKASTTVMRSPSQKDTRIATWLKSFFSKN